MESYQLYESRRPFRAQVWRLVPAAAAATAAVVCVAIFSIGGGESSLLRGPPGNIHTRSIRRIQPRASVGEAPPSFSLPSESGKKISLESFKGPFGLEALSKPVVVFFYGGQGSPSCTKQAEAFRDAYPEIKAKGAEVLGISRDSNEFSQQWRAEKGLPFPLLADEDGSVREAFGIKKDLFGLLDGRETYVVGKDGKVKMKFNSQFQPEKHVEKVLDVLAEIA